jgi:Peptidase family M23
VRRLGGAARRADRPPAVSALTRSPQLRAEALFRGLVSPPRRNPLRWAVPLAALIACAAAAPAAAALRPAVSAVECLRSCADGGAPRGGSLLLVTGRGLAGARRAVFAGRPGEADDRRGRLRVVGDGELRVRVPWEAEPGPLTLASDTGPDIARVRVEVAPLPAVSGYRCVRKCAARKRVRPGSLVQVRGVRLSRVTAVSFFGGASDADDRPTPRVGSQTYESFRVRVPRGAATGPFRAAASDGATSPERRISIRPRALFPVRGDHGYGERGARFGAGRGRRGHQGQDVFADCGTPLVAARGGRVRHAGFQRAAGHYLVIDGRGPSWDYVYMHMEAAPAHDEGDRVSAGEPIGTVGDSGNASACHLHFELWSAPGWYEGGEPFDPLPYLRHWDRTS